MPVAYDLSGRTAVVTGGSKGIGRAIVERLSEAGAQVWNWDVSPDAPDGVAACKVDVTNAADIERAVAHVVESTARIDILVNNAGFTGGSLTVEDLDPADWRRILDVNLTGVFEVSRQVVPVMRRGGWGRIVNIASLSAAVGILRRQGGGHRLHEGARQGARRHQHPREQRRAGGHRDRHPSADGARVRRSHGREKPDEAARQRGGGRRTRHLALFGRVLVQHGCRVRPVGRAGNVLRAVSSTMARRG
jgi:NAD(P)-dependent dehydrogenase (short-subunit alcohol dehydrogenase family)